MEPESFLPSPQEAATLPQPKSDSCTPVFIPCPRLCLGHTSGPSVQVFPIKLCICLSSVTCIDHFTLSQHPTNCPSQSQINPMHVARYPISRKPISILYSHLRLCLQSGFLSLRFPTKTLYASLVSTYACCMPRQYPSS